LEFLVARKLLLKEEFLQEKLLNSSQSRKEQSCQEANTGEKTSLIILVGLVGVLQPAQLSFQMLV